MSTLTLTAGAKIKIGQMLSGRMVDEDTSEPLLLVFPIKPGENPIGVAMSNAEEWEQVTVATSGHINTITVVAGERLEAGFVYIGDDGKAYQSHSKQETIYRYVIAGADLKRGQRVIFDRETMAYIPAAEGQISEGFAARDIHKGGLFEMVVARYDPESGQMRPPKNLDQ